jgi:hypothetical protein
MAFHKPASLLHLTSPAQIAFLPAAVCPCRRKAVRWFLLDFFFNSVAGRLHVSVH